MQKKHRSASVLDETLPDFHHHPARLAWLMQEYLFSVKKLSGLTLKI